MNNAPETRHSLLLQIRDPSNQRAWQDFTEIYRPLVYRIARLRGLQHADADDLAQQILLSVAGAIPGWEPDSGRARFRTWLKRVADNAIINALTRRKPDQASGRTSMLQALDDQPINDEPATDLLDFEYRREVFRWAAKEIQGEFHPETWQAFWQTSVEESTVNEVAQRLGKTRGAIYVARSRVIQRLQAKIQEFDDANPSIETNGNKQ